jgi:uncharacterized cupin superfamily protein
MVDWAVYCQAINEDWSMTGYSMLFIPGNVICLEAPVHDHQEFAAMNKPIAAMAIPERKVKSIYPAPFAELMQGRSKRRLGDHFGLTNFGVNLTEIAPGGMSALKHCHQTQDEFIYILSGMATLVLGDDEFPMVPGDCIGLPAGSGLGHHLLNRSQETVVYLEVGDRSADDNVDYPDDDLQAVSQPGGGWQFLHKDGKPY